jgi:hypothetical protein
MRYALWENQHAAALSERGGKVADSVYISLSSGLCILGVLWTFNRNDSRGFEQASEEGDSKEGVLRYRGETAGQHGRHQHGVNEAAGMPCDVQSTAFGRKVLIINDVNFAKPDVREKLIETASKAVG